MKKLTYITFGDRYSGIYQSQVIDLCLYFEHKLNVKTKIIAFVPYPVFKENKKILKSNFSNISVCPMLPSRNHWYMLYLPFLLIFFCNAFFRKMNIFSRGIWATSLIVRLKKIGCKINLVYDGRGAALAEWKEYIGVNLNYNLKHIQYAENLSVTYSDKQIAVSSKLVEYWKEYYKFNGNNYKVIPCTIGKESKSEITVDVDANLINTNKVVIVFSGGIDKWQSFDKIIEFSKTVLSQDKRFFFLFLTKENNLISSLKNAFPENVLQIWVKPQEVNFYLQLCDYGILIRENSITNSVASPTKLAEYLINGITPIISDNIGDYSNSLLSNNLAVQYEDFLLNLKNYVNKITGEKRDKCISYALNNCTKEAFKTDYLKLLDL